MAPLLLDCGAKELSMSQGIAELLFVVAVLSLTLSVGAGILLLLAKGAVNRLMRSSFVSDEEPARLSEEHVV
jgi:hypothetical protein